MTAMSAFRAVVFDRDGVLTRFDLDRAAAFFAPLLPMPVGEIAERWFRWQEEHGFPTSLAAEGRLWASYWEHLGDRFSLSAEKRALLHEFDYTAVIQPHADARPALQHVRRAGARCGVFSNFSLASIDASLAAAGFADLVDVACAGYVVGVRKPEPQAYHFVAAALGVAPAECLFFDDEAENVDGARAVGMRAYLVDRSLPAHEIERGVVRDLSALPALL